MQPDEMAVAHNLMVGYTRNSGQFEPALRANTAAMTPLEADLRRVVRGEVRFDAGSRALYSTDASNYRQLALGVVLPRDARDVEGAIAACRRHGVPVLSRGGGTSLAGETCNEAVVIDFSKYTFAIPSAVEGR